MTDMVLAAIANATGLMMIDEDKKEFAKKWEPLLNKFMHVNFKMPYNLKLKGAAVLESLLQW
eukprot:11820329-Prorocentrum_lima.AAC.1